MTRLTNEMIEESGDYKVEDMDVNRIEVKAVRDKDYSIPYLIGFLEAFRYNISAIDFSNKTITFTQN